MSLQHYVIAGLVGLFFIALVVTASLAIMLERSITQPVNFDHQKHFTYFRSGEHRQFFIRLHEDRMGEIMEEVTDGACIDCHGEFAEAAADYPQISDCGGCHDIFLKSDIVARRIIRPCVGCHRSAVSESTASIPEITVCAACHEESSISGYEKPPDVDYETEKLEQLAVYLDGPEDIAWLRVCDYLPGDIVFSHERHVMLGEINCQQCHGEENNATSTRWPVSLIELSMEDCIDCHESAQADNDCLACHR